VKQHKFTGGLRTDESKQLNSVMRSMRITRKCNSKDLMKTNNNRCEVSENDFAHGEDSVKEESKKRRFMVKYECRYGKRDELPDDYSPAIAPPPEAADGTTQQSSERTTQNSAQTTQQPAQTTKES